MNRRGQEGVLIGFVVVIMILLLVLIYFLVSFSWSYTGAITDDKNRDYDSDKVVCRTVQVPYTVNERYIDYGYSNSLDDNVYFGDFYYRDESYGRYYGNFIVSVKNTDRYDGDFSVRFYYLEDGDNRVKTITRNIDAGEREEFIFHDFDFDYVYDYRVVSEDGLRYDSDRETFGGDYNRPIERTRTITEYRTEVK